MYDIVDTLQIPEMVCQIAPPTPPYTLVNRNKNGPNSPIHPHLPRQPPKYQPTYGTSTRYNAYRLNTHLNFATIRMGHSNHLNILTMDNGDGKKLVMA